MHPPKKAYKPGHRTFLGFVLGTFIGLLLDELALGMIFGFLVGAMIDSSRRKAAALPEQDPSREG